MKFRCERDTLVEALSTAGRAVATRGGALPVLSGVRLEVCALPTFVAVLACAAKRRAKRAVKGFPLGIHCASWILAGRPLARKHT